MKRSSLLIRYGAFVFSIGEATRIVGLLITSLTFPYLVRRLGVATYGRWSYVVAVCGFLGIIANPGLGTYATQTGCGSSRGGISPYPRHHRSAGR